jgi:di/tricarboxylate transporter
MLIIGRRLLPERDFEEKIESSTSPEKLPSIYRLDERLFELKVTSKSLIAGKTLAESRLGSGFGLNVIDILHSTRRKMPKDRLLVQGREEDILSAAKECGMEVKRKGYSRKDDFMSDKIGIAEVVLAPRSQYAGKKLKDIYMRERFGITVLAIWRGGNPIRARLGHEILQLGDALLLRGPRKKLSMLSGTDEFLPVSGFVTPRSPQHRDRMIISVVIIALMLSAVVSRLLPLSLAALTAAALMVVTRCLTVAEAYRSIEWRVVIFLGGIIPFGDALVKTGLIDIFVRNVFAPFAGLGTLFISGMLFLVSSAIALLTSNITAAILLCPVALSMSGQFDISPEMLLITVALGASNGFMTPVAQQPNLVVMGPGSYSVKDYLKAGAGMSAVVFLSFMIVSYYKGLSF